MFDIGFSELVVIGLVALVVVGPKRLPVATRTLGTLVGRAQRYVNDVKSDIQRQMDIEELRKVQQQVQNVGQEIQAGVQRVETEVSAVTSDLSQTTDAWEGFESSESTPVSRQFGTHIHAPEPSWSEQQEQRRIRERVRGRLRKRFHVKRPRD
ncbi:MAG: twin-arginine translocase subunit TatB [Burkholderiaceae bacterium]|nr:twin-arginine translocase subunit TatB [Burkholderiaceae bacterium]